MKKAYAILNFDIKISSDKYNSLKKVSDMGKSEEEYKKELHIKYIKHFMKSIREAINLSSDEELKKVVNNYMSIYLKGDNKIGVVIYDAIKRCDDDYAKVEFETTEEGKFYPFIIYKNK